MRKIITHTTSLVLHFVFAGLFFLTSCDNFLDGGNLKELLEKDIAYAESPFYEIHLECDDNAGTFTGSTNLKQKVTDIFSVEFKIKSGYRFSHWEAYSKKTDNSIKKLDPDYIEFISFNTESTDGLYKTDVRFIKEAADITIRPVCLLIPEIQDFYPPYNPSGYEQNSAIKITFNKPMDAETFADYSCISIYTESGSLSEYFENPHFNEDKTVLTVMPKESMNILTPDSGDKLDVSVYIDFTDIKDADGLPLSKVSPFTYRINDGLLEHQKVRLTEDTTEGTGVFVGFGEKECTTGYSIEVQFTVNKSEYRFEGLEAVNSNNEKIENAVWFEQISEDEESGTYRYKIYVNETVKDIKIRPVCTLLTSINVTITGSNGKFSPAKGEKKCTMTHTYPLSFEPDSDYEFIRWEIYNKKTNTPIENSLYINIADPSLEETSYSLKKAPEDSSMEIAVRPVIAERPQIISYSPMTSGVFKDSAIQIVFDRSMAPSSIYYTLSELNEIFGHDLSDAEEAANEPYKEIIDDTVVYYGYVKDGEVFFKNISIINNITKKNLNSCFTHPVFNNSSSIAISVDKTKDDNNKYIHELDAYTQLMVTVDKGIYYIESDKPVEMTGSKKWLYQVTNNTDNSPLKFTQTSCVDDFKISFDDETPVPETRANFNPSNGSGIANFKFMNNRKLYLDLKVTETDTQNESGPLDSFNIKYKRLFDENYTQVSNTSYDKSVLYNLAMPAGAAGFKGNVEFPSDIPDGIYEITLDFSDKSGNTFSPGKKYYIVKDNTKPAVTYKNMSSSNNSPSYVINWSTVLDVKKTEVIVKKNGNTQSSETKEQGVYTATVTGISTINDKYDIILRFTDYAGNTSEVTVPKFLTGYKFNGEPSFYGTNGSKISSLLFAEDYISYYNLTLTKYYSDGTSVDVTSGKKIPEQISYDSSRKLSFSLTESGVTKEALTDGSYYTAKKNSLTQSIEKIPNYSGSIGTSGTYYKFGDWPQSIKLNEGEDRNNKFASYSLSVSSGTVYNGWYLGSDGYFYEKCQANPRDKNRCDDMSNGNWIKEGNYYYFKVEPIIWRRLGNTKILVSEKVLDGIHWTDRTSVIQVSNQIIYPNNYKYSLIRAYLNGSYESNDTQGHTYSGCGFYQKAFAGNSKNSIATTTVYNNAASTNPNNNSSYWNKGINAYACDTTYDKVFLLSEQELTNANYGFSTSNNSDKTTNRYRNATDYAKAKTVYQSQYTDYAANWWTRSSCFDNPAVVRGVNTGGKCNDACNVTTTVDFGVVPAITVTSLP